MTDFIVADITCGGCANSIKRALAVADPQAIVEVDVASKRVRVTGTPADTAEEAIRRAGFTPQRSE